jgi:hypothetical protein
MSERQFQEALLELFQEMIDTMASTSADLTNAITSLTTAVDAFIAAQPTADDEAAEATSTAASVQALTDLTAKVVAATPVPAVPVGVALTWVDQPITVVNNVVVDAQLSATGGLAPYSFTVTGLPAGLTADVSGKVTGAATAAGVTTAQVTVTDASSPVETASGPLTVTVS